MMARATQPIVVTLGVIFELSIDTFMKVQYNNFFFVFIASLSLKFNKLLQFVKFIYTAYNMLLQTKWTSMILLYI